MSSTLAITMKSSVVKKQLVGITGLLLCGFLVTHLAGNFLLLVGPEAFNKYGHALTSNPLIYVARLDWQHCLSPTWEWQLELRSKIKQQDLKVTI